MQPSRNRQSTTGNVIDEVIIKPRGLKKVFIGIYEENIPIPRFLIKSEPNAGELLSAKLVRKDENGEYSLTYFLQNYSDQTCRVSIVEGESNGCQRMG